MERKYAKYCRIFCRTIQLGRAGSASGFGQCSLAESAGGRGAADRGIADCFRVQQGIVVGLCDSRHSQHGTSPVTPGGPPFSPRSWCRGILRYVWYRNPFSAAKVLARVRSAPASRIVIVGDRLGRPVRGQHARPLPGFRGLGLLEAILSSRNVVTPGRTL